MNTFKGNFTEDEKDFLNWFDGFTFWKVRDEYSFTGIMIYAKHESWDESKRIKLDSVQWMWTSLNIASRSGGF